MTPRTSKPTTRRAFLAQSAAVPAAASPLLAPGPRAERRPNILFALADDWLGAHTSIGGDPLVKTPTFDRISRAGVRFTNAFVSAPSCTPSRAAMLTGQWHWRLEGGANLGGTLPAKFPVYPDLLEAQGYHVGFTRKGWGPGNHEPGGRKRNPAGPQFKEFAEFLSARPKDAPFCFWFGTTDPHRPYAWESGVNSGMRLDDARVPPYFPDHEIVRKDICDYAFEVQRFDRETGELLAMIEKAGELDNTIVVMSGDNGWPFPRAKATLYEAGTHVALAVAWGARAAGGRVVEDFVSLADLAPTFLEAAGIRPPEQMSARSLLGILTSGKSGRVEARRDHILTGMERHVPCRGESRGGYPMRALRNRDFHLIRNFQPDRWPAGDPNGVEQSDSGPYSYEELVKNTFAAFADIDAGPTKAYMVTRRNQPEVRRLLDLATAKRPERELYDLKKDPYQLRNVAGDPAYADILKRLDAQLTAELKASGDPRVLSGLDFDQYPRYQRISALDDEKKKKKR